MKVLLDNNRYLQGRIVFKLRDVELAALQHSFTTKKDKRIRKILKWPVGKYYSRKQEYPLSIYYRA